MKKEFISHRVSFKSKVRRFIWNFIWVLFFRSSPRVLFAWRSWLLNMFGAKIGPEVHIYPSVKVWAPWNLEMKKKSCLSDGVDCYSVDKILIGEGATVSQYTFLCTASRDYSKTMQLVTAPIVIGDNVWVAADVFVGPGVAIGDNSVVYARSTVINSVANNALVAGSPAKFIKSIVRS